MPTKEDAKSTRVKYLLIASSLGFLLMARVGRVLISAWVFVLFAHPNIIRHVPAHAHLQQQHQRQLILTMRNSLAKAFLFGGALPKVC